MASDLVQREFDAGLCAPVILEGPEVQEEPTRPNQIAHDCERLYDVLRRVEEEAGGNGIVGRPVMVRVHPDKVPRCHGQKPFGNFGRGVHVRNMARQEPIRGDAEIARGETPRMDRVRGGPKARVQHKLGGEQQVKIEFVALRGKPPRCELKRQATCEREGMA